MDSQFYRKKLEESLEREFQERFGPDDLEDGDMFRFEATFPPITQSGPRTFSYVGIFTNGKVRTSDGNRYKGLEDMVEDFETDRGATISEFTRLLPEKHGQIEVDITPNLEKLDALLSKIPKPPKVPRRFRAYVEGGVPVKETPNDYLQRAWEQTEKTRKAEKPTEDSTGRRKYETDDAAAARKSAEAQWDEAVNKKPNEEPGCQDPDCLFCSGERGILRKLVTAALWGTDK